MLRLPEGKFLSLPPYRLETRHQEHYLQEQTWIATDAAQDTYTEMSYSMGMEVCDRAGETSCRKANSGLTFGWCFETLSLFKIREERETGQIRLVHNNDCSSEN